MLSSARQDVQFAGLSTVDSGTQYKTTDSDDTVRFDITGNQIVNIASSKSPPDIAVPVKGLEIDVNTQVGSETEAQTFQGFGKFTTGSGDDTITFAAGADAKGSEFKSVDGGAGNNTIIAGLGGKTVYYGGSYGNNVLSGLTTIPAIYKGIIVTRLVGGPSADDVQYHTDNPNLPSLGTASASNYKLTSGVGSSILVGGAGMNEFDLHGSEIVWGGNGKSTYKFTTNSANIVVARVDNPTAEKIADLDFSWLDGSINGATIIVDPGPGDRIGLNGKTVTDVVTDNYGGYYSLNATPGQSLTFSDQIQYTCGGMVSSDSHSGTYAPASNGQYLRLRGFHNGDFGIQDAPPRFTAQAFWIAGTSGFSVSSFTWYGDVTKNSISPITTSHSFTKANPGDPTSGFTSDEIASIEKQMNTDFTTDLAQWQPANDKPTPVHAANADGDTLTPTGPSDTLIGDGKNVTYSMSASNGASTVDNFSLNNTGSLGQVSFDGSVASSTVGVGAYSQGDVLLTNTSTGKTTTISRALANPDYAIGTVAFTDGTTYTQAQLAALAVIGSPTNTGLYGFSGADAFDSRGFAYYAHGVGPRDSFAYAKGYGALRIDEAVSGATAANTLLVAAGIDPASVTVTTNHANPTDLVLNFGGSDVVTLSNALSDTASTLYGLQSVQFANGVTWSKQVLNDLAASGTADMLWRGRYGETITWQITPDGNHTPVSTDGADPSLYKVIGYADGTGDNKSTILFTNTNGDIYSWSLTSGVKTASAYVGTTVNPGTAKQVGFSDGAGADKADILFVSPTNDVTLWHLDPNAAQKQQYVGYGQDQSYWTYAGFTQESDGHTDDVLWRGGAGQIELWVLKDGVPFHELLLGYKDSAHWSVAGFASDAAVPGRQEILWRGTGGETEVQMITNEVSAPSVAIDTRDPAIWSVASFTNTVRNGEAEIVWRNTAGDTDVSRLQGTNVTSHSLLTPNVDNYWYVAG